MRRPLTTLAVTATLVVGVALPAWAAPTFVNDTVPVDTDVDLRLRSPDPEGRTTVGLDVTLPSGFAYLECSAIGWTCELKGSTVVFTQQPGPVVLNTFTVRVHTPVKNGTHAFPVTQRYGDNSRDSFTKAAGTAPVLTVTGAQEPEEEEPTSEPTSNPTPQPTTSPTPNPSPPAGGGTTTTKPTPTPKPTPTSKTSPTPTPSPRPGATTGRTTGGGGSTGPFRTETSRGSSFDITPGSSVPAGSGVDAPSIADPDVAVAEPIAPDEVTDLESAGAATDAEDEGSGPGRWIGLALLLAGGAAAFAQRRMARS